MEHSYTTPRQLPQHLNKFHVKIRRACESVDVQMFHNVLIEIIVLMCAGDKRISYLNSESDFIIIIISRIVTTEICMDITK